MGRLLERETGFEPAIRLRRTWKQSYCGLMLE